MKIKFKIILIILTIIFALIILFAFLLPSVIDLSKYKERINSFISETVNRDVSIYKIKLTILSGLGAELTDIKIGKDPELFGIESMRIRVSILPLLQGRIELKDVSLKDIRVFLGKVEGKQKLIIVSHISLPSALIKGELIEIKKIKADLYKGKLLGDLTIEKGKRDIGYNLFHNIESLEVEQLIKDAIGDKVTISGPLKLEGGLKGIGNNMERLEGSGSINIGKGKIKGIELTDIVGSIGIITTKRQISLTDFDKISGSYIIGNGYLKTENLEMTGKDLYLKVRGTYGIVNSKLDFLVQGQIIDIPVEVKIEGTRSKPVYHLKTSKIEKKVIEELGKSGKERIEKKGVEKLLKDIFKK